MFGSVVRQLAPKPLKRAIRRVYETPPVIPCPSDEFLAWLRFVNPGMLSPGNIALFDHCSGRLRSSAPVIEIGSFCGLSLNSMSYLLSKHHKNNEIFSVDAWHFEGLRDGEIGSSQVQFSDYRKHVIETFRRNVTLFSRERLPHHIEKDSDDFFTAWGASEALTDFFGRSAKLGGPISMAYIDGAHTYEQSMRDFRNVDRFLEVGGFIIFDDSADDSDWESNRTAREAAGDPHYKLVAKNPNYCIEKAR